MAQEKKKPSHKIRLGSIVATIWDNTPDDGRVSFNVVVTRSYKDKDGNWKETSTFRRDDLPIASKAFDMAHAWIWGQTVPADPDEAMEQ